MKKTTRIITILIFIFLYIPMAVLIVASFNTGKDITEFDGFTLNQYAELFRDQGLLQLLGNSLLVSTLASLVAMVFVPAVSTFYISQKLGGTDTVLIGDVIERQFKQGNNPNLGAALSLVLMILVFVCTGIMNRFGADEEGGVIA